MKKLAINGGEKVRELPFPAYNTIGIEEEKAVSEVLKSGCLSRFLGAWHEDFFGGDYVRKLEKAWAEKVGAKHAISVNSATSALICAVGATQAGPGDEIIVSPYTMSASATSILFYNAVPIFADIEKDYYCLDPESVECNITDRTKAIVVVDIFGQPYDADRINEIAKKHNLIVIEDCSQAPGAMYKDRYAGTLGDMGIYSLNYHKHIHSGEGGIIVTDDDELAERLRLIRNHAEAVVEPMGRKDLINMMGYNFRMTEIEAAIAYEQLLKLDDILKIRIDNVKYIEDNLKDIKFLKPFMVREGCKHSYYVHGFEFDEETAGISRNRFVEAVKAELSHFELRESEGVKMSYGYVKPLYLLPLYQQKVGFGNLGCPFKCPHYTGNVDYTKVKCANCEDMHFNKLIIHEFMINSMSKIDMDDFITAVKKVVINLEELK